LAVLWPGSAAAADVSQGKTIDRGTLVLGLPSRGARSQKHHRSAATVRIDRRNARFQCEQAHIPSAPTASEHAELDAQSGRGLGPRRLHQDPQIATTPDCSWQQRFAKAGSVHVLLRRYDHPSPPPANRAELLGDSLQVEHQVGVGADELADLVHKERRCGAAAPSNPGTP
jgi:hypothetical protein